jgi:hypothetical protein
VSGWLRLYADAGAFGTLEIEKIDFRQAGEFAEETKSIAVPAVS